jgi:hypothetical protein
MGSRGGWVEVGGGRFRDGRRGCFEEAGVGKRLTGGGRLMLMGVLGGDVVKLLM